MALFLDPATASIFPAWRNPSWPLVNPQKAHTSFQTSTLQNQAASCPPATATSSILVVKHSAMERNHSFYMLALQVGGEREVVQTTGVRPYFSLRERQGWRGRCRVEKGMNGRCVVHTYVPHLHVQRRKEGPELGAAVDGSSHPWANATRWMAAGNHEAISSRRRVLSMPCLSTCGLGWVCGARHTHELLHR